MGIIGNTFKSPGFLTSAISAYAWHRYTGATYVTVCSASSTEKLGWADIDYFSFDDGIFTCLIPGEYTIEYFAKAGRNSSGTERYIYYTIYVNDVVVKEVTTNAVGNGGGFGSIVVELSKNDTIHVETKINTGTLSHDFGYVILPNF